MMKISERTKRILALTGGVIVCAVLLTAIGGRFKGPAKTLPVSGESLAVSESLVVKTEPAIETEPATKEAAVKPTIKVEVQKETAEVSKAEKEETKAPVPVQTDREEQAIQPAPEKPMAPPKEVLENPEVKPNGETVAGMVEAVEHENVERPSEPPTQAGEPQAGDTKNGQIYVPGFGWVEDHGGGGSGTVAEDMYENGNKIGIMN